MADPQHKTTDLDAAMEAGRARAAARTEEAIRDVFARMPWGQRFTLADGKEVEIVPVTREPRAGEHGSPHLNETWRFMFDVRAVDGSFHIEFMAYQSGWGGVPV